MSIGFVQPVRRGGERGNASSYWRKGKKGTEMDSGGD